MSRSSRPRRWTSRLLAVAFGTGVAGLLGAALLVGIGWTPPKFRPQQQPPTAQERERQAFDELRERVQPRVPTRALSRRSLHVESSVTPHAELLALRDELLALVANLDRGANYATWGQSEEISERLALFPWRYGHEPREVEAWEDLSLAAELVLDRVECRQPPELVLAEKDSYAQLLRCLLLELAGRTAEADTALESVEVHHFCGNCAAGRLAVVDRRRSEAAERRGETEQALELLRKWLIDPFGFGSAMDAADPVTCTRCALLFAQTGRDADAAALFQLIADLRPDTPSAAIARAALQQMDAWIEPTPERLESLYIATAADEDQRSPRLIHKRLALVALAHVDREAAFTRLSAAYDAGEKGALEGLVELRDERAKPYFDRALTQGEADQFEAALRGLAELEGGARAAVAPMLRRLEVPSREFCFFDQAGLDARLRAICGGGPELRGFDRIKHEDLARSWLDWLRLHAPSDADDPTSER